MHAMLLRGEKMSIKMLKTVCIINNYNYARYLHSCIDSAINQSTKFDLILIIDDGSTDESREILKKYAQTPNIKVALKDNGGQLSCFNAATGLINPSDFITLLDADDVYPTDYLENLLIKRAKYKSDLYFCEPTYFQSDENPPIKTSLTTSAPDFVWETSSRAVRWWHCWTGSPTSCISLSGKLFLALLPLMDEENWRTRADDIVVFGSSICGASKCYLPSITIGYRIHGTNGFYGKKFTEAEKLKYELKIEILFNYYFGKFHLQAQPNGLKESATREVRLVPDELRARFHIPSEKSLALDGKKGLSRLVKKARYRYKQMKNGHSPK
jgi:glycosyltransferase involved in cell wall biosynthesis